MKESHFQKFTRNNESFHILPSVLFLLLFLALVLITAKLDSPAAVGFASFASVIVYLRYFNELHGHIHAKYNATLYENIGRALVEFYLPTSPFGLSHSHLRKVHLSHHKNIGDPKDFDYLLTNSGYVRALFMCLFQPEFYFVRHIVKYGFNIRYIGNIVVNSSLLALLYSTAGSEVFWTYLAIIRTANFLAWFVFATVLHQPKIYGLDLKLDFFTKGFIKLLFGKVYKAVFFHKVHHTYPSIPDERLDEVKMDLTPSNAEVSYESSDEGATEETSDKAS